MPLRTTALPREALGPEREAWGWGSTEMLRRCGNCPVSSPFLICLPARSLEMQCFVETSRPPKPRLGGGLRDIRIGGDMSAAFAPVPMLFALWEAPLCPVWDRIEREGTCGTDALAAVLPGCTCAGFRRFARPSVSRILAVVEGPLSSLWSTAPAHCTSLVQDPSGISLQGSHSKDRIILY